MKREDEKRATTPAPPSYSDVARWADSWIKIDPLRPVSFLDDEDCPPTLPSRKLPPNE